MRPQCCARRAPAATGVPSSRLAQLRPATATARMQSILLAVLLVVGSAPLLAGERSGACPAEGAAGTGASCSAAREPQQVRAHKRSPRHAQPGAQPRRPPPVQQIAVPQGSGGTS
jgi:hypothetical protein